MSATTTLFTVGHSSTSAEELAAKLEAHGVRVLIDVRRYPSSRRYPQFNRPALAEMLAGRGLRYLHEEDLGGYREPFAGSPNTGLPEGAFRGYADHMGSHAFRGALDRLLAQAAEMLTAVMCAEADPTQCHRNLLADALVAQGCEVFHILGPGEIRGHTLHPNAHVIKGGRVIYPDPGPVQLSLFAP